MLNVVVELSNSHVRLTLISKVAFFFIPSQISGNWSIMWSNIHLYIYKIQNIYFFLFTGFTLIVLVFPFLVILDFLSWFFLILSFFFLFVFFSFSNNLFCSFLLAFMIRNIDIKSRRRKSKTSNAGITYPRISILFIKGTIGFGPFAMNQFWLHPSQ